MLHGAIRRHLTLLIRLKQVGFVRTLYIFAKLGIESLEIRFDIHLGALLRRATTSSAPVFPIDIPLRIPKRPTEMYYDE